MSVPLAHQASKPVVLFIVPFQSTPGLSSLYNLTERTGESHTFINTMRTIFWPSLLFRIDRCLFFLPLRAWLSGSDIQ